MAWRFLNKRMYFLETQSSSISRASGKISILSPVCYNQDLSRLPLQEPAVGYSVFFSTATPEQYAKRNYANNISEYNTVFGSLMAQKRTSLMRDGYEDMMLDGIQPNRDAFHSLVLGAMMGANLQDGVYFMDEMKSMGMIPDATIYNFIIGTCARTKNADYAMQVFEEMKRNGVKPRGQTYIALLSACASCGRVDEAYSIIRDMTAAGLGLNRFCYAALIIAFKNKKPVTEETMKKIVELVNQSKGWSSAEAFNSSGDPGMINVSEEELYHIPSAEVINNRSIFLRKELTTYHTALHACADLGSKETAEIVMDMIRKHGYQPDTFCVMQLLRCYLVCKDFEGAKKILNDYIESGNRGARDVYITMIKGAMAGYTPEGMELAQDTLQKMIAKGWFLNRWIGSELLTIAAREPFGGYTLANYIWDTMRVRQIIPTYTAVEAYHRGLKEREIPADDPRLANVTDVLSKLQRLPSGRTP
eukprot:TRINITY_DN2501_c0_g1_i1.p1 TRINITY_DN2501_c0_g1~~TRINITY_DN2501_c0_g1_i1.p1  ORF type:complete len:475 (+),score=85.23 TRINITY_DN2501_c0_g1_i1:164-1588(+)